MVESRVLVVGLLIYFIGALAYGQGVRIIEVPKGKSMTNYNFNPNQPVKRTNVQVTQKKPETKGDSPQPKAKNSVTFSLEDRDMAFRASASWHFGDELLVTKSRAASYISFDVGPTQNYGHSFTVIDGLNKSWRSTTTKRYSRIQLPVRIENPSSSTQFGISIKNILVEANGILDDRTFSGSILEKATGEFAAGRLAKFMPGTRISFDYDAKFFENYTDMGCALLHLRWKEVGGEAKEVCVNLKEPNGRIEQATAPVSVEVNPACMTSRLPEAKLENKNVDYQIRFTRITPLGD